MIFTYIRLHYLLYTLLIALLLTPQNIQAQPGNQKNIYKTTSSIYKWRNINLNIDQFTRVYEKNNILKIHYFDGKINGRIDITSINLPSLETIIEKVNSFDQYINIKISKTNYINKEALYVESITKDTKEFIATYYIPSESIYIAYAGPRENFQFFKPMIESIRFTDEE